MALETRRGTEQRQRAPEILVGVSSPWEVSPRGARHRLPSPPQGAHSSEKELCWGESGTHRGALATKGTFLQHLHQPFHGAMGEALTLAPGVQTRRRGAAAGPDLGLPLAAYRAETRGGAAQSLLSQVPQQGWLTPGFRSCTGEPS